MISDVHPAQAERALAGALILSPDMIADVAPVVLPSDFMSPDVRAVYTAVVNLWEQGRHIDIVTLQSEANLKGDVIGKLMSAAPSVSGVMRYADAVVSGARLRRLSHGIGEIQTGLEVSGRADPDIVLSDLASVVDADRLDHRNTDGELSIPVSEFLQQHAEQEEQFDWIVPGFLRRRWRLILAGEEGIGKMVVLRQIAYSIAAGVHPWFANKPITPSRVLMIDVENPHDVIADQTRLVNPQGIDLVEEAGERIRIHSNEAGMNISEPGDRRKFERIVAEANPDVVVAGPLYKLTRRRAGVSDWDADSMDLIGFFDHIRVRYDCALLLEHHLVGSSGSGNPLMRSSAQGGSTNFRRWPEFSFSMIEHENARDGELVKLVRHRRSRVPDAWPRSIQHRTTSTATGHAWQGIFD